MDAQSKENDQLKSQLEKKFESSAESTEFMIKKNKKLTDEKETLLENMAKLKKKITKLQKVE